MTSTRIILLSVLLAACGDDPVNYSAPVGIELKAKSGDVSNNVVSEEKGITTESGNPFSKFVSDAQVKLGRNPGSIDIDKVTLLLGANSTGVTKLEEVLSGAVEVLFITNDSNNTFNAASGANPTGGGPVELSPTFDFSLASPDDQTRLLNGSFKVVIRGAAATGFSTKGAEASMQLTFTFSAFE